jgi:hypothetical protein
MIHVCDSCSDMVSAHDSPVGCREGALCWWVGSGSSTYVPGIVTWVTCDIVPDFCGCVRWFHGLPESVLSVSVKC